MVLETRLDAFGFSIIDHSVRQGLVAGVYKVISSKDSIAKAGAGASSVISLRPVGKYS